jgi:hypothetical protein
MEFNRSDNSNSKKFRVELVSETIPVRNHSIFLCKWLFLN